MLTQTETQRPKHSCSILRRQPSRLRPLPNRITPRFLPAIKTVMSSNHRLFFVRFRSLPGETRLVSGFCQYAGPSDNRALCKVADLCPTCRVYSPLSLRLRLHNAGDYPTCQPVAAAHGRFTLRDRLCRLRSGASLIDLAGRSFMRSALFLATRRQTGPPRKCGGFGRRCGPHRS